VTVASIGESPAFIMFVSGFNCREPSPLCSHWIPTLGPSPRAKKLVVAAMLQIQTLVRNVRSQAERGLAKKLLVPLLERIRYSSIEICTCKNPAKLRSCRDHHRIFCVGCWEDSRSDQWGEYFHISMGWSGFLEFSWAFYLLSIKYESDHFFLLAYFFL